MLAIPVTAKQKPSSTKLVKVAGGVAFPAVSFMVPENFRPFIPFRIDNQVKHFILLKELLLYMFRIGRELMKGVTRKTLAVAAVSAMPAAAFAWSSAQLVGSARMSSSCALPGACLSSIYPTSI